MSGDLVKISSDYVIVLDTISWPRMVRVCLSDGHQVSTSLAEGICLKNLVINGIDAYVLDQDQPAILRYKWPEIEHKEMLLPHGIVDLANYSPAPYLLCSGTTTGNVTALDENGQLGLTVCKNFKSVTQHVLDAECGLLYSATIVDTRIYGVSHVFSECRYLSTEDMAKWRPIDSQQLFEPFFCDISAKGVAILGRDQTGQMVVVDGKEVIVLEGFPDNVSPTGFVTIDKGYAVLYDTENYSNAMLFVIFIRPGSTNAVATYEIY